MTEQAVETDHIRKHLELPIPECLWHYTTMAGCEGILRTGKIYATDARFLNDRLELKLAQQIAEQLPNDVPTTVAYGEAFKDLYRKAVDVAFRTGPLAHSRTQVFVACFSKAEDSLPQWRGYSHGSYGVSLGFDLRHIRESHQGETRSFFAPCIYKESDKKKMVEHALQPYLEVYTSAIEQSVKRLSELKQSGQMSEDPGKANDALLEIIKSIPIARNLFAAQERVTESLTGILALLKDASFLEEEEWRLVIPVLNASPTSHSPSYYRTRADSLVPTVEYDLGTGPAMPLRRVIVGPGVHENADSALSQYLRSKGLMVVARHSRVPYRST